MSIIVFCKQHLAKEYMQTFAAILQSLSTRVSTSICYIRRKSLHSERC